MKQDKTTTAIVAMTEDRVIGKDGGLPWRYPEDLKRFKSKTIDSTIIMGRKTWESIGSRPLPGRRNIVISRRNITDVESYNSIEETLHHVNGEVWIIGGGQIYKASLDYCDAIDITWIPETVDGEGLVKFPVLDESDWQGGEKVVNENDYRLTHQLFTRVVTDT